MSSSWQDRKCCPAKKKKKKERAEPSGSAFAFRDSWRRLSASPLLNLQLLPEGLLLRPRLLRQHAGGEHGGEGGEDEVGGDPVPVLHPALPLHELPGAPGQVRRSCPPLHVTQQQIKNMSCHQCSFPSVTHRSVDL